MFGIHRTHGTSLIFTGLGLWLLACSPAAPCNNPPVFGGSLSNAQATPLTAADGAVQAGPCGQPSPAEARALIDDFEDGNDAIAGAFEREGWLYVATDDTPGTATPARGGLKGTLLPEAERSTLQQYALHAAAEGFSDWGVSWGMTLRSVHGGSKCSMNASNFKGIRFRARGKGRVAVNLQVPEVVPGEYEGRCKDRCWDTHKKWIVLGEQWQSYSLPWDVFQQDGWGVAARFSPSQLLGLTFAAGKGDLPVDLWVDDVEFISDAPPVAAAAAPATVAPATVTPAMPDAAARP